MTSRIVTPSSRIHAIVSMRRECSPLANNLTRTGDDHKIPDRQARVGSTRICSSALNGGHGRPA